MRLGLCQAQESLANTEANGALLVLTHLLHPKRRPVLCNQPLTGNKKTLLASWVPLDALRVLDKHLQGAMKGPPEVCCAGLVSPYCPGRCKSVGEKPHHAGS